MARCKYCGKYVDSGSMFILEGKYPKERVVWWKSVVWNYVAPEEYGDIYHKECYFKKNSGNLRVSK